MKKIVSMLFALILVISMTGCASLLKSAGALTKSDLAAHNAAIDEKLNVVSAQIEDIKAALAKSELAAKELVDIKVTLAQLSADLEAAKLAEGELEKAKATIDELTAKVETLSDKTLLKLSQLIQNALAATGAK